jgi:hypothetical protein
VSTDDYILPARRVAGVRPWRLAPTLWAQLGGWCWSLTLSDCWRKLSAGPEYEWKEAKCDFGHTPPGEGCTCGIYAYHAPSHAGVPHTTWGMGRTASGAPRLETASGVIICDGEIIPATLGFRAQYAKIAAIFDLGVPAIATPEQIAADYRCDIITPDEYYAFCAKHGLRRLDLE